MRVAKPTAATVAVVSHDAKHAPAPAPVINVPTPAAGTSNTHRAAPAPSIVTKAATTVEHAAAAVGNAIVTGFTAQAPFGIGVAHGISLPQPTLAMIVFVAGIVAVQRRRRRRATPGGGLGSVKAVKPKRPVPAAPRILAAAIRHNQHPARWQ